MCSAESFLYHPIFRLQFNQGNICIPELWKLQSFLSLFPVRKQRNGSCYTLIYAQPLKHFVRLQSSLRKKNLPIAQDCRLLFCNNNHHTVEHLRVDIVLATTQTILLPLFPYLCISRKVTASVQVNKYFSEYLSTQIYHHFTRYLCNKLS